MMKERIKMEENNIVFGKWEAICMVITIMSTQIYLGFPRFMAESAGPAGWILTIYISILAALIFTVIQKLYVNFEGMDLIEVAQYAGGNIGRIVTGSIVIAFLVFIASIILREFSEDMKIISLRVSPISFVAIFFLIGITLAAFIGFESILRFSALFIPIIILAYLLIIIATAQFFDISRITPILGTGPYDIFIKGIPKVSIFSGLLVLFLINPFIKTHNNFKRVGYSSIILTSVFLTIASLSYLLVYPYPNATENFLPIYQMARLINYGRFFERVESIFVLVWAMSALLYLSALLFFVCYIFKKTFKLRYYKPVIIPFALLIYTLSFIPQNLVAVISLENNYIMGYGWIVTFLITIVLLTVARFKKRVERK